jgi:hypothetical protein
MPALVGESQIQSKKLTGRQRNGNSSNSDRDYWIKIYAKATQAACLGRSAIALRIKQIKFRG